MLSLPPSFFFFSADVCINDDGKAPKKKGKEVEGGLFYDTLKKKCLRRTLSSPGDYSIRPFKGNFRRGGFPVRMGREEGRELFDSGEEDEENSSFSHVLLSH